MKETLKVLNAIVVVGIIQRYAIGGAVAAIYYLEPIDTVDLDIFVQLQDPTSKFDVLSLMNVLRRHGLLEKWEENKFRFSR